MLFDVSPEGSEQCVQTHFVLVAPQRIWIMARIVLERHEGLQQIAELAGKLGATRVLLDFSLADQAFAAGTHERKDFVAQQVRVLRCASVICALHQILTLADPRLHQGGLA